MKWSVTFPRETWSSFMHYRQVVQALSFLTTTLFFFLPNTSTGQQDINFYAFLL